MSESVEREEGGVASKSSHSDSDQHERVHEQSDQGDQSDSSIGHPLNFKDGHHSTDLSCNSMKSDRSMDPPLSLRDGHHSTEHRDHQKKGLDGQCDQEQQTEPGSLEKERKLRLNLQEELKRSQESIMDLVEDLQRSQKSIMDLQNEKKENTDEITFLLDKIGDAQSSVHLQKTIKEKQARIKEVQEELDAEHAARSNVEKQRDDLHLDLERAERDNRKLEEDLKRSQESIMDLQRDKQQSDHKITEQQALIKELEEAEVRRRSAVDVTLDPDTAHPKLILSDDGKQVYTGNIMKNLPNNKERFDTCVCVLGKQGFSSGRFYFEVQVKSKTEWDLGVARESINRKGNIPLTPNNGYWTIVLRNGNEYEACAGPAVLLPVREKLQTVGVFVDYEEGLVSFYDVEARVLLYSFTGCSFTERLYPYFCPCFNNGGINSAPLIIL